MSTALTFIIPVRHQDNAKDWSRLKSNLRQTLASISAQTGPDWRAIVVANEGADLPAMPDQCEVVRVTFPPNQLHDFDRGSAEKEAALDAFRLDKGRRVLSGMLHARDSHFFMIVDDDDFVSKDLALFVSNNRNSQGWVLRQGYIWGDGGDLLYVQNDFSNFCGTSLIVRADQYELPEEFEDASLDYIKRYLGSHIQPQKIFLAKGSPLKPLPFRGAIYRVGHPGAHSRQPSLLKLYILNRATLLRPFTLLRNLVSFRYLTPRIKRDFFGAT